MGKLLVVLAITWAWAPVGLSAQEPFGGTDLAATGAYTRAFGGNGIGLELQVLRITGQSWLGGRHALGGHFWFARTDLRGGDISGERRTLLGLGVKWQSHFVVFGDFLRPFIAVPIQFIQSRIPSRGLLLGEPRTVPLEDRVGNSTGLAAGVEMGADLGVSSAAFLRIGGTALYHTLFDHTPIVRVSFGLNLPVRN